MLPITCAICGEKEQIQELYKENFSIDKITNRTFSARRIPDRIHYRLVKCLRCTLIFSNPILPQNKIIALYKKSTFEYENESLYLKKTYGYFLQKILTKTKKEPIHLLDVGCGNGFFLEEAKERGVGFVYGIEPGSASVKKAPKWLQKTIKIGILKKDAYKNNSFDIVCCFHTLDHIIEPNAFLEAVYAILKKNGKALFIVHDTEGLSVKLFSEKSPIFDIEHIFLFNRKNLSLLFIKNKFTVLETFPVKNTYPVAYWIRNVPLPKQIKKALLSILKITKLENVPLSLNAGNIGIIVKK